MSLALLVVLAALREPSELSVEALLGGMMNLSRKIVSRKMCRNDFCCYLAGEDGVVWLVLQMEEPEVQGVREELEKECTLRDQMQLMCVKKYTVGHALKTMSEWGYPSAP